MSRKKRFGAEATAYLAGQTRTKQERSPRNAETYPGVYLEWIERAARDGEVVLTLPDGINPFWLQLELRRFCRALLAQHHTGAAAAAAVMVKPPQGRDLTIVRRDAKLQAVVMRATQTPFVAPLGSVGKLDQHGNPIDALETEVFVPLAKPEESQ